MARGRLYELWSWDERNGMWLASAEGTQVELAHRRDDRYATAALHGIVGAAYTVRRQGDPPLGPPGAIGVRVVPDAEPETQPAAAGARTAWAVRVEATYVRTIYVNPQAFGDEAIAVARSWAAAEPPQGPPTDLVTTVSARPDQVVPDGQVIYGPSHPRRYVAEPGPDPIVPPGGEG